MYLIFEIKTKIHWCQFHCFSVTFSSSYFSNIVNSLQFPISYSTFVINNVQNLLIFRHRIHCLNYCSNKRDFQIHIISLIKNLIRKIDGKKKKFFFPYYPLEMVKTKKKNFFFLFHSFLFSMEYKTCRELTNFNCNTN